MEPSELHASVEAAKVVMTFGDRYMGTRREFLGKIVGVGAVAVSAPGLGKRERRNSVVATARGMYQETH